MKLDQNLELCLLQVMSYQHTQLPISPERILQTISEVMYVPFIILILHTLTDRKKTELDIV